jgi:hypothetical protein
MRSALLSAAVWVSMVSSTPAAEPVHRQLVTSLSQPEEIFSHKNLLAVNSGPWSVSRSVLRGGKQEGVELIVIDNGRIQITLVPTRGMSVLEASVGISLLQTSTGTSVLQASSGGVRLGWNSPVKDPVHPQFVDLGSRGGLGWLEGFNEAMVRCGLEFAGHPGKDQFIDNTGARAEMDLTLHGKIGNIPASDVEVIVDSAPPHRIHVRGVVHERSFFGPKLELAVDVSTVPGSDEFRIEDAITNRGATPQEFQLIYHANLGSPLLEQGATVAAAVDRIAPMNVHAAKSIDKYDQYDGPTTGFIEQVYLVSPLADEAGRTAVLLRNAAKDRGVSIAWSTRELPYLTIWKNTAAEADGYVTGLEPGTGFPYNRKVERQNGRVPVLAPGATRRFTLDFGLHNGAKIVSDVAAKIAAISKGHTPRVESEPPKIGH